MQIRFTGRRMEVTEAMREYVGKKLPRLEKYSRKISDVEVTVEEVGKKHRIELIVKADNFHQRFVASHMEEDAYACFDMVVDKMERQLAKNKDKVRDHRGRVSTAQAGAIMNQEQEQGEEGLERTEEKRE